MIAEGGKVTGVLTSRGRVATSHVVLAAGPWIVDLARTVGVDLPISSSRHPVLVYKHQRGRRPSHVIFDIPKIMYSRPEGKDLTLVGTLDMAHSQEDTNPDQYDERPTFDEVSRWGQLLMTRFPAYDDVEAMRGWCGIYEYTQDWHHILDELPTARAAGQRAGPAATDSSSARPSATFSATWSWGGSLSTT